MLVATFWLAFVVATPGRGRLVGDRRSLLLADGRCCSSATASPGSRSRTACSAPGRARISGAATSAAAEPLDAEATRRVAGRDADARAYLLLRPYLKRAVRVTVARPGDPTPYWLVEHAGTPSSWPPPSTATRRPLTDPSGWSDRRTAR